MEIFTVVRELRKIIDDGKMIRREVSYAYCCVRKKFGFWGKNELHTFRTEKSYIDANEKCCTSI